MAKELATTPGRGRKLCPGCNKYPGVRSRICQCGHEFSLKASVKKLEIKVQTSDALSDKIADTPVQRIRIPIIHTPNGAPPVKLEGTSIEQVRKWMLETRAAFADSHLSSECLGYWVRHFYPYFKQDEEGNVIRDSTVDIVKAIIRKIDNVVAVASDEEMIENELGKS